MRDSTRPLRLYDACQLLGVASPDVPVSFGRQFVFEGWTDHPPIFIADEIATGLVEELAAMAHRGAYVEKDDDIYRGLVPPYKAFMVEADLGGALAASFHAGEPLIPIAEITDKEDPRVLVGASTSAMDLSQVATFRPDVQQFLTVYRTHQLSLGRWYDPKWLFSTRTLVWVPSLWPTPVGSASIHLSQVSEDGDELGTHTMTIADDVVGAVASAGNDDLAHVEGEEAHQTAYLRLIYAQLGVTAFTISSTTLGYLAAVNVTTSDHRSPLQRQQRRRLERETGKPYDVTYKTLDVVTGKGKGQSRRALTTLEGNSPEAAHMVRGHLKTYGEEAPLFGRHVGTWYWPPHLRGSDTEGRVVKDYRVRTPEH